MNKFALLILIGLITTPAFCADIVVIRPEDSYSNYSNENLRRRVWELEKAVAQLQRKVFELELGSQSQPPPTKFTCYIQAFGKTFTSTKDTRSEALANVMSKCSQENNAMFCTEEKAKCGL